MASQIVRLASTLEKPLHEITIDKFSIYLGVLFFRSKGLHSVLVLFSLSPIDFSVFTSVFQPGQ